MTKEHIKILIADDHEIVRCGVRFTLEKQHNLHVEDEASSYKELQVLLHHHTYDLLILDLNLGDKNGLHSIEEITKEFSTLPILVLSMFPEDPYALQSIQAGASGYLNKKVISQDLLLAIETILEGKTYIHPEHEKELPLGSELSKRPQPSIASLSKREYEVYELLTSGMTSKEISEKLSLSPKTISTYRTRILEKLSLSNTTQLIHFSLQHNLGKSYTKES
jgi:DNA-binding NarL/FixJ family response regulator